MIIKNTKFPVIPVKTGIQKLLKPASWIPACAGMTKRALILTLMGFFLFMSPPPAHAEQVAELAAPEAAPLPPHKDLAHIERYLQNITTYEARFTQTAEVYGEPITGTVYIQRPGRLRFQYDAPIKDYIVADGRFIYYWDGYLETYSSTLISQTLAAFILREDVRLNSGDIIMLDATRRDGLLGVTVAQRKDPEQGRLTLIFQEKPLKLVRWQIVDGAGYVTQIELTNIKENKPIENARRLFRFVDPAIIKPGFN